MEDKSDAPEEKKVNQQCKEQIIQLLEENEKGVSEKTLQIAMSYVDVMIRAGVINDLLSQNKIELLKQGSQLVYKLKKEEKRLCDSDEESVVYAIIEEASNRGIWMRDIRTKSKLPMTQLNKVLKSMENKKLIKAVKSVSQGKKKVYMLYDIEPDTSVTGGTWYSNNDFESEFVEVLNQQCFKYLKRKAESVAKLTSPIEKKNSSYAKSSEICDYINELGISKVNLTTEDIEAILETLVFDGKIEKSLINASSSDSDGSASVKTYRAINPVLTTTGLMRMPCGLCPVAEDCHDGGVISPSKCVYFNEWFEL